MSSLKQFLFTTLLVLFFPFSKFPELKHNTMELAISNSSLRVPIIIPRLSSKASSYKNRVIPIKPITKGINKISSNFPSKCSTNNNLILPVGLYGENKFSNSLLYGQDRRDTIRVLFFRFSSYNNIWCVHFKKKYIWWIQTLHLMCS